MASPSSWFEDSCIDEPTWFDDIIRDPAWFDDEMIGGGAPPAGGVFTTLAGRGGLAGVGGVMVGPGGGLAG